MSGSAQFLRDNTLLAAGPSPQTRPASKGWHRHLAEDIVFDPSLKEPNMKTVITEVRADLENKITGVGIDKATFGIDEPTEKSVGDIWIKPIP